MKERTMMIIAGIFLLVGLGSFLFSSKPEQAQYDVTVQTINSAADGLDLQAVGALVKKAKDAGELERLINSKEEGVNNLDLNEDGKVDYVSVDEYGKDGVKGFSLTTQPAPGETQELATIQIEKTGDDKAQMEIKGNDQIYGQNHYFQSHFGLMDMLILGYLFSPHPFYSSPWGWGHYPYGYSSYGPAPYHAYQAKTEGIKSSSNIRPASASAFEGRTSSPNSGKFASSIKASLTNPTVSQKSFQARNPSTLASRAGFGRTARSGLTGSQSMPSFRGGGGFGRGGGFSGGK